jgi:hypothetical protein
LNPAKKMHLGPDLSYAHMGGRWRMPGAMQGRRFPNVELDEEIARRRIRRLPSG